MNNAPSSLQKVCSRHPFPVLAPKTNPEQVELWVTLEGMDRKIEDVATALNSTSAAQYSLNITWWAEDSDVSKNLATCVARRIKKEFGASLLPPRVAMHIPMETIVIVDRIRRDNRGAMSQYLQEWKNMPSISGATTISPKVVAFICERDMLPYTDIACYIEDYSTKILTQLGLPL